jgi:ribosomal protein L37E
MIKLEDCSCNFRNSEGKPYVVRCPACKRENYAMAVATGVCAWCGWDANKADDSETL